MFGDSSDDDDVGFTINKKYADRYNTWRRAEEMQKLKDRYGDVALDSDSSSTSESEDEEGEALTSTVEKGWLKTLAALKNKDPRIYQKDAKFYSSEESSDEEEDDENDEEKDKKRKEKPLYLKDYETKLLLENYGKEDSGDSDSGVEATDMSTKPGYFEQQEQIRKSLLQAVGDSDSESDSELLTHRKKTLEEEEQDEDEYVAWLKGRKKTLGKKQGIGKDLEPLQKYWNDPALDEGEKFLKDFILNKRYMDKDSNRIPTYDEIIDDSEELSEDDEEIEEQEQFERKYNFRFEEPGAQEIKSFPRSIDDSVRRKDTKRAEKRQEKKERKKTEKEQRQEELKQLKSFKRQEIEQKIDQLREITGNKEIGFSSVDIEGDFDPAEHDRMMQKYFADDYYGEEEEEKPVCKIDEEDLNPENWDSWAGGEDEGGPHEEEELHIDDPGFVMDADYDPNEDNKVSKKKKRKKNRLAKALSKKKPVFDPEEKTFEEYVDEYYKLDYEDMIGDVPCRFKYRKVTPNNFGLDIGEILTCRDKELNSWVSVKKMSQYRSEEEERRDLNVYSQRAATNKKLNILTSLRESEKSESASTSQADTTQATTSKRKRKKKNQTDSSAEESPSKKQKQDGRPNDQGEITPDKVSPDTSQRKNKSVTPTKTPTNRSDDKAEGVSTATPKNSSTNPENPTTLSEGKKKRRKKKKKKNPSGETTQASPEVKASIGSGKQEVKKNQTSPEQKLNKNSQKQKFSKVSQKQKSKKKGGKNNFGMSNERLKAYGIDPKKIRFMKTDNFMKQKKP